MTYLCFIECETSSVPHMEPLETSDLTSARAEAARLLRQRARPVAAHVFKGNRRLLTITPDDLPS